jgi:ATP adenylyltransferase
MLDPLHAPWRMAYIKSLETKDPVSPTGCFLCDAVATLDDPDQRRQRLVLWHSEHSIVLINKYPYTSGHLLVAPRSHKADLESLTDIELSDLSTQTARCVRLLKAVMNPQGFNVGMNLGRAAGAGLPGHLHQHIVSRWSGDTNFISVIGEVRIIPHAMTELYQQLTTALAEIA